jgi:hypothetical protein
MIDSKRIERVCSLPPRQATWAGLAQGLEELVALRRLVSDVQQESATKDSQRFAIFEKKKQLK